MQHFLPLVPKQTRTRRTRICRLRVEVQRSDSQPSDLVVRTSNHLVASRPFSPEDAPHSTVPGLPIPVPTFTFRACAMGIPCGRCMQRWQLVNRITVGQAAARCKRTTTERLRPSVRGARREGRWGTTRAWLYRALQGTGNVSRIQQSPWKPLGSQQSLR